MKLEAFFDHLFKFSSIFVSVLTFALSSASFFIFIPYWYAFGAGAFVGLAFGVYIAYVLYVKFQKEGNTLGLVVAGSLMATLYIMPSVSLYHFFLTDALKKDAVYQVLLTKKSLIHYDHTEVEKLESKLSTMKQSSFRDVVALKNELKIHLKNEKSIKNKLLENLNNKKYAYENGEKIRANDGVYTGIWKALKQKGYSINGIESVASAQYSEKTKDIKARIKEISSLVDTQPIAKLEAKLEALSLASIEKNQRELSKNISERIKLAKDGIGWTESQGKAVFFFLGLFFEIFLNSASFWLATFSGLLKRLNLLSTAHLEVGVVEVEEVEELDPLADAKKLLKTLCDTNYVLKALKKVSAVHAEGTTHAGKPLLLNGVILGMVTATVQKSLSDFSELGKQNYFSEIKWEEVYKFTKKDTAVPIMIDDEILKYKTFGGHPKRVMKDARERLQNFNPLSLKFDDILKIMDKK